MTIKKNSFSTKSSSLPNFRSICRTSHDMLTKVTVLNGTVKCNVKNTKMKKRPMEGRSLHM